MVDERKLHSAIEGLAAGHGQDAADGLTAAEGLAARNELNRAAADQHSAVVPTQAAAGSASVPSQSPAAAPPPLPGFDPAQDIGASFDADPLDTASLLQPETLATQETEQPRTALSAPLAYAATWGFMALFSVGYLGYQLIAHDDVPGFIQSRPILAATDTAVTAGAEQGVRETSAPAAASTSRQTNVPAKLQQRLAEERQSLAEIVAELAATPNAQPNGRTEDTQLSANASRSATSRNLSKMTTGSLSDGRAQPLRATVREALSRAEVRSAGKTPASPSAGSPSSVQGRSGRSGSRPVEPKTALAPMGFSVVNAPPLQATPQPLGQSRRQVSRPPQAASAATTTSQPMPPLPARPSAAAKRIALAEQRKLAAARQQRIRKARLAAQQRTAQRAQTVPVAQAAAARSAVGPGAVGGTSVGTFETSAVRRAIDEGRPSSGSLEARRTAAYDRRLRQPGTAPAMGVQLARDQTLDGLRVKWAVLKQRHAASLGVLSARYVRSSVNGGQVSFRLIAGPLPGAIQALQVCQDVASSGTECIAGDFVGNAL